VQVNALNRPEMLIEIELDAVDAPAPRHAHLLGRPTEAEFAYSRALRVGDRVFVSGTTTLNAAAGSRRPATCTARRE